MEHAVERSPQFWQRFGRTLRQVNKEVVYCLILPYPKASRVEKHQYQVGSRRELDKLVEGLNHRLVRILEPSEYKELFWSITDEDLNSGKFKPAVQGFLKSSTNVSTA